MKGKVERWEIPVRRLPLKRETAEVRGEFGKVDIKTVFYGNKPLRSKP